MGVPRLIGVTAGRGLADLEVRIPRLVTAGLPALLLREPTLGMGHQRRLLMALDGVSLLVHDRNPGARALCERVPGLGLHVPGGALEPGLRERVGGLLGVSCHAPREIDAAFAAGADYVFYSPVWRPGSKRADRRTPLGPDRFLAVAAGRPVLALGGLTGARLAALRGRGAWGGAMLGALFEVPLERAVRTAALYGKM